MFQTIARCPYCQSILAFDPEYRKTVFDPDRLALGPCAHLACYWICLSFVDPEDDGPSRNHSRLWEIGRQEYAVDGAAHPNHASLCRYLCDYGFKSLPSDLIPIAAHKIEGGSAQEREQRRPGTGEFSIFLEGLTRTAILDGWAVFGLKPKNVRQEILRLSHEYEI